MTLADLLPSLRTSLEHGIWPLTTHQSCAGTLTIGGVDTAHPAASFGTPVIAFDVRDVRERALGIPAPRLTVEPGRALVARAGVTIYRVGAVERGLCRTFVAVDGGMSDNPRPALYGARYPVRLVERRPQAPSQAVTVVGRHCESSDVIAEDVLLPADVAVGDLVAVPCSGAYHASPASTYNHVGRPPVVAVTNGAMLLMLRRDAG